ncbi:MAG: hypothetical protein SRB1_01483 [Desulfobacteraceae bacterium Eth-SRB1]|nr:MAG: hypothetical protein SRB1_01483 [Desulfobacteraceae bacterium Eth-SRB1]
MDYIARHYHMDLALARPPRLSGNHLPVRCTQTGVQKMQDKRILGTVGRTLLIAKRS